MLVETFTCKNCGANINIPNKPGKATCNYCGSTHQVSFHDGLVTADLIAKVEKLDKDISLLKGKSKGLGKPVGLRERLEIIKEGKKEWHEYVSLINAGKSKSSPEMVSLYKEAQEKLLLGYGPGYGEHVNNYYNPKILDDDPMGGYSCLSILLGITVLLIFSGIIAIYKEALELGKILIAIGSVLILAGIPFITINIRIDKLEVAKREEAKVKLLYMENKIRQHLSKSRKN